MKEYDIQTARELEIMLGGSREISRLMERRPDRTVYRLDKDKMSVIPTGDYFEPLKIHSYLLDLTRTKNLDDSVSIETRTLATDTREIFHDLAIRGSQQVGTLKVKKLEDVEIFNSRGFVRILYRTEPKGKIQEGYILCDLNNSFSTRRRFNTEIESFEDAPHELMDQAGYLHREDVYLTK